MNRMHANPTMTSWLAHRTGLARLGQTPFRYIQCGLKQNDSGEAFVKAFGKKELQGFVGFIDLVDFSRRVVGQPAAAISSYLQPFLTQAITLLTKDFCLIDKTIGDEVMFVVPELLPDGGPPANIYLPRLLADIRSMQRALGPDYRMRLGVAVGELHVDCAQGEGFTEWTVVGECVNLAKRLHSLEKLKAPQSITCALGALEKEQASLATFQTVQSYIQDNPWRIEAVPTEELQRLRGISSAKGVYLLPD